MRRRRTNQQVFGADLIRVPWRGHNTDMLKVTRNGQVVKLTPPRIVDDGTNPEITAMRLWQERHERNAAWAEAHMPEILAKYRGKHVAVAGQELFVADTNEAARAKAQAAHPEDDGIYGCFLSEQTQIQIHAH
jgi:hypothetical protein